MKLHYYEETDSLYIGLLDRPSAETLEIADGFNVDLDANGNVVGFDIDRASTRVDLTTLEVTDDRPSEGRHPAFPSAARRFSGKWAISAPNGAPGKAECLPSAGRP